MLVITACSNDNGSSKVEGESSETVVAVDTNASGEIQEVKAKIAHVYPTELFISKGYEMFAEKVKEKSKGKIEFTIFPAGQLYTDVAAPNAVSSGQIEMAVNTLEMWSSNVAAAEFTTLPIFDNQDHLRRSMDNGINDLLKEELNKFNAEPLLWAEFGFSYFASSKKPLSSPEDFKNKKIRTTAPLMSKFVELAGGSPISLSGGEVPQALQRGTIDAAVSGVAGFAASQYFEYTDYYTGPFNAGLVLLSANTDWWNGLNDATREVIFSAAAETEAWLKEQQELIHKESVVKIESEGMKYAELKTEAFAGIKEEIVNVYKNQSGELGNKIIKIIEENR
jgi:TRAP-type C4-dicarboxylate transport system substrate-binding protein